MRSFIRLAVSLALFGSLLGCGSGETALPQDAGGVDVGARPDGSEVDAATPAEDGGMAIDGGDVDASGSDVDSAVMAGDPSAAGPFTVTMSSETVGEATLVSFVPSGDAPVPLVILKHGFQLSTANYEALAERVASHGFLVIGVDTAGGLFGGPTNADERDASVAAIDWALADAPFAARVDAAHIAIMGHSRGGKVAVMVAAADPRVTAALLLDPVNGCGPGAGFSTTCPDVTTAAFAGALDMPVGVMGETNNATGGFMPCAPMAQNYQTIYDGLAASSWAVEWTFTGADHMDFTDDGGGTTGSFCTDGPGDDTVIRADVRTMAVAFMRRHLRSESAMDAWLTGASIPSGITHDGP